MTQIQQEMQIDTLSMLCYNIGKASKSRARGHIIPCICAVFFYNGLHRKLEKCQMPQDFLCLTKSHDRRNTACIAREQLEVRCKIDKADGASEVFEEV